LQRKQNPFYLAFYLLLMFVCPKRAKLAFILPSMQEIDACLFMSPKVKKQA
jgi:hypothetical protein